MNDRFKALPIDVRKCKYGAWRDMIKAYSHDDNLVWDYFPLVNFFLEVASMGEYECPDELLDCLGLLLRMGYSTNSPTNETDDTALHTAIYSQYHSPLLIDESNTVVTHILPICQIVRLLLEYGADVKIKDVIGSTPLTLACTLPDDEMVHDIVTILLDYGADISPRSPKNETPMILCQKRGHIRTTYLLNQHGSKECIMSYDSIVEIVTTVAIPWLEKVASEYFAKCPEPGNLEFKLGSYYRTLSSDCNDIRQNMITQNLNQLQATNDTIVISMSDTSDDDYYVW